MAAPSSTSAGYFKVPDWAVKNKAIFLSACGKAGKERSTPAANTSWTSHNLAEGNLGARSMAVLGAEVENAIVAPPTPPNADYFRDVANHPDVLCTIINTCRLTVGFLPQLTGANLTPEEAEAYVEKFKAFLAELDRYFAYVNLNAANTKIVQNNPSDCKAMLKDIAAVVEFAMGAAATTSEDLTLRISKLIKLAVDNVLEGDSGVSDSETSTTISTTASFEMVALPASNVQGEEPSRNPPAAVAFCPSIPLSKQTPSGQASLDDSFISIRTFSYQLRSSVIIEYAQDLAGIRITSNQALADFINSPLTNAA